MHSFPSLAWLHWNPPREAFTLPFLDLSIAWYGIFFAGGFLIGYFLLLPILRTYIYRRKTLAACEVSNWPLLAEQLKVALSTSSRRISASREASDGASIADAIAGSPLAEAIDAADEDLAGGRKLSEEVNKALKATDQLSSAVHMQVEALPQKTAPSEALKSALLSFLSSTFTRKRIEELFPGSIVLARTMSQQWADTLTWFIVVGTVVGARLGHVFFYDWPYMKHHLWEIVMIRQGGLASHGGTLGVLLSLMLFLYSYRHKFPGLTFIGLVDLLTIPTGFVVACIRLGNFFNQEILGTATTLPWGVVFENPTDNSPILPRHPVQLYEAAVYLITFGLLMHLWKKYPNLKEGVLSGLFFLLIFGTRFFLEFLKMPQSMLIDESFLQMGQLLSLPFILLGGLLLLRGALLSRIKQHFYEIESHNLWTR
jgi:prolipoprotein diacylglyceryl transferase